MKKGGENVRKGEAEAATPASSLRTPNSELRTFCVAVERLIAHPLNSNRMPPKLLAKLESNIRDSGRYPSLVVRTLKASPQAADWDESTLQVIDGHHRLAVLKKLGHKLIRVDCWGNLTDSETELLLATLNRLEGSDDAERRAELLEHLRRDGGFSPERLAELLPEDGDAIEALELLRNPPPLPKSLGAMLVPVTLFMTEAQRKIVRRAIGQAKKNEPLSAEGTALAAICEHYLGEEEDQTNEPAAEREVGTLRTRRSRRNVHPAATGGEIRPQPVARGLHHSGGIPKTRRAADSRDPRAHSPVVLAAAGQSASAGRGDAGLAVNT